MNSTGTVKITAGRLLKIPVFLCLLMIPARVAGNDPVPSSRVIETRASPLRIWLGGDVQPGAAATDILAPLVPLLGGLPGIVNLEGPIGDPTPDRVTNSPASLERLQPANIRVLGVANNHAMDLGGSGVRRTVKAIRDAGLLPAGGPAGAAVLEVAGLAVVVSAHDLTMGVPDLLPALLKRDRKLGDVLVVRFHVTGPPSYIPRPELRRAVDLAVAAGAAVIAAEGTHAIGPVERRGSTIIAWGLGNLAFECDCTTESDAIVLIAALTREGCATAEVLPIEAGLKGKPARPSPDAGGIFDLLKAIGSTDFERRGDRAVFERPAGAPR